MPDSTPAVSTAHPPAALMRVVNPVLGVLLRIPATGSLIGQMMVLTVTGRKTGRQYKIPLSAHRIDDTLYALTTAAWKNNFRGGATAQVLHNGKTTAMRGELITDPATVGDLSLRCAQSYGVKRAQTTMGLKFRDGRIPSLEEFTDAAARNQIYAVRLTPA